MSIFGGSQDPDENAHSSDIDIREILGEEFNLDDIGYSVEAEKVKHAIWKDGFVARWAMILLLVVTAVSLFVIGLNALQPEATPVAAWAMEIVKTIAVAFVGFLAGGASASKGA